MYEEVIDIIKRGLCFNINENNDLKIQKSALSNTLSNYFKVQINVKHSLKKSERLFREL